MRSQQPIKARISVIVASLVLAISTFASAVDRWTVPFGAGLAAWLNLGKLVDLRLQGFYNVEKPKGAADWSLQLQFKMLFPK